jgi:hypothetical protein
MPSSRFALGLSIAMLALLTLGAGTTLAAAPANDNFASPSILDTAGNNGDILQLSSNLEATKEVAGGEQAPTNVPTYDRTVWHLWTAPVSGSVSIDTCGTTDVFIDTILSVYTGSALNSLTKISEADNGCGSGKFGARVTFAAVSGVPYRIRIAGFDITQVGTINMKIRTVPYINVAPNLTGTATAGEDLATNGGNWYGAMPQTKAYTWLSCADTTIGSCTPISTFAADGYSLQAADVGTYIRVSVSPENAIGTAPVASVSPAVGPISAAPPINDNIANATDLGSASDAFQNATNAGATLQGGEPTPLTGISSSINSVWFKWTAPTSGPAVFSTCSTAISFDGVIAIYDSAGTGFESLSKVASDDDGCGTFSGMPTARGKVTGGKTYWIQVASYSSSTTHGVPGPFTLTIALAPPNDDFADAVDLGNSAGVVAESTNYNATREASEPDPFASENIHTVWFKWTAPSTGNARFDTCSSTPSFDGVLAVYSSTGAGFAGLTKLGSDDDGCSGTGSMATKTIAVTQGTAYFIQVGKRNTSFGFGPPGPITLKVGTAPVNVTPPSVAGKLNVGQTLTATQGAWQGFQPIDFSATGLWFRCGDVIATCNPIPGATELAYTLTADDLGKFVLYSEFPSNALGNTQAAADSGLIGPIATALAPPPSGGGGIAAHPVTITTPTAKASKLKAKIKKGAITLPKTTISCAASAIGPCTGTAALSVKIGKKTVKLSIKLNFKTGSSGAVVLPLSKSAVKKLAKAKKSAASAVLKVGAPGFAAKPATVKFTLG